MLVNKQRMQRIQVNVLSSKLQDYKKRIEDLENIIGITKNIKFNFTNFINANNTINKITVQSNNVLKINYNNTQTAFIYIDATKSIFYETVGVILYPTNNEYTVKIKGMTCVFLSQTTLNIGNQDNDITYFNNAEPSNIAQVVLDNIVYVYP